MYKLKALWHLLWSRHFYIAYETRKGVYTRSRPCNHIAAHLKIDVAAIECQAEITAVIEYAFENPEQVDIDEVILDLRNRYQKRDKEMFNLYEFQQQSERFKKEFLKVKDSMKKPRN